LGLREFFTRRFPELRREPRIEFLGEQDGPSERQLKELLVPELRRHSAIKRAYLARLGFQPHAEPSVGLCLVSLAGEAPALVASCAALFRGLFADGVPLDIVFLTREQEEDLVRVCRAFYTNAA
jgi:hypothetical protein